MEYEPMGNAAAAAFLKNREYDLKSEIERHPEPYRGYVAGGIQKTLLHNIMLPADQSLKETNRRAMEGLLAVKKNRRALEELFSQLEHLFNYYEKALAQTYSQFKERYRKDQRASKVNRKRSGTKLRLIRRSSRDFRRSG